MASTRLSSLLVLLVLSASCGSAPSSPATPADAATADPATAPSADGSGKEASAPQAGGDAPPPAGTYRIVLDRPSRAGEKVKISTKATESSHQQLVQDGKVVKEEDNRVQVSLVADEEVLAVSPSGKWTKAKLTLTSFTAAGQKGDETILPPGTVLTIERAPGSSEGDKEAKIVSSSGELTKEQRKALKLAFPSGPITSDAKDDDTFGTKEPRAPGASWDISRDAAVRDLERHGAMTSRDLVEGRTTLVAVKDDRGEPCLEIAARFKAKLTGASNGPKNAKIEGGVVNAEALTLTPVDAKKGPHRVMNRVGTEIVATIDVKGKPMTLNLETLSVTESTYERR